MNLWDTEITISVSQDMTMFRAAKLPFKNMLKVACTTGIQYCASTFKDNKRDYQHWNPGSQLIIIDFDEGLNALTEEWLRKQFGFLVPTRNHNKSKNGITCPRYRAILLTDKPMNVSAHSFVNIHKNILYNNNLPADKSCVDVSRLFYGFGNPESIKDIRVLNGSPIKWVDYDYEDTLEMIGLPSPKKVIDLSKYEHIDLSYVMNLNKSKRYECPICAMDGLDPSKHHMGFSLEKDLLTCFYDKEGHSPILRALYQKQMYGEDPIQEEIKDKPCPQCKGTGKINGEECPECRGSGILKEKKKRKTKPKTEPCPVCEGAGRVYKIGASIISINGNINTLNPETGEYVQSPADSINLAEAPQIMCEHCKGSGVVKAKPKPRPKKPSLPDNMIPLEDVIPHGRCCFSKLNNGTVEAVQNIELELAYYENCTIIGMDTETYYPKRIAIPLEEAEARFKPSYISTKATYKRVEKNLKEGALDEIDNRVRLITFGAQGRATTFDLSVLTEDQLQRVLNIIRTKIIVGHNLKFDLKSLASVYGIDMLPTQVFDTMLASKILWMAHNTWEPIGTHSLKGVVERYCKVILPKEQGDSDWGADILSEEQIKYALDDVVYLEQVFYAMCAQFKEEMKTYSAPDVAWESIIGTLGGFVKIHPVMALEMRFLLNLIRTELHGVMINESAVRNVVKELVDEIDIAEKELGFNPASNPESLKFVRAVIGPQMESANKEALAEYYHIPQIEKLGRAKQAKARAGLLVKLYDKKSDGRIHTQYTQILSTARMASKNPNMQQVPRTVKEDIYKAPEGRFICSGDYPAIELRLGSVVHKEPVMIESFQKGEDLHYRMAHIMTGKKIPKTEEEKHDESGVYINKEERTAAKNCFERGTEILTDKGWVKVEELQDHAEYGFKPYIGDYRLIHPITQEKISFTHTYKAKSRELIHFELENGDVISVTPDHRFPIKRGGKIKTVFASEILESDEFIEFIGHAK